MIKSKLESGRISSEHTSSERLLRDIEEISKALYLHKISQNALVSPPNVRSKSVGRTTRFLESKSKHVVNEELLPKEKKSSSSMWNWKPLKALTHIRTHRFKCWFFLHVHSIESLPSNFNDLSLCVHWKRKGEVFRTRTARVCQGMAEFGETLMHQSSVKVSKNGPHHSAKYAPKLSLLYPSVIGAPGLDIGKHLIDLTRFLPLNLEDLEGENSMPGKWTTSFKLIGKAKGAILNVSFRYRIIGSTVFDSSGSMRVTDLPKGIEPSINNPFADFGRASGESMLRRLGSAPSKSNYVFHLPSWSSDIEVNNEVSPNGGSEITQSFNFLHQTTDEEKLGNSEEPSFFSENSEHLISEPDFSPKSDSGNSENGSDDTEFTIIEQGIEIPMKDQSRFEDGTVQNFQGSVPESLDEDEIFEGDGTAFSEKMGCKLNSEVHGNMKYEIVVTYGKYIEDDVCSKEPTVQELESVFHNMPISEPAEFDSSRDKMNLFVKESYLKTTLSQEGGETIKPFKFDDDVDSVVNDFCNFLGIEQSPLDSISDSEPESPRERLLRQFEKDALASGHPIFDVDALAEQVESTGASPITYYSGDCLYDFEFPLPIQGSKKEHDRVNLSLRSRKESNMLEKMETKALMKEWDLNEMAFFNLSGTSSGGFGSPVEFSP